MKKLTRDEYGAISILPDVYDILETMNFTERTQRGRILRSDLGIINKVNTYCISRALGGETVQTKLYARSAAAYLNAAFDIQHKNELLTPEQSATIGDFVFKALVNYIDLIKVEFANIREYEKNPETMEAFDILYRKTQELESDPDMIAILGQYSGHFYYTEFMGMSDLDAAGVYIELLDELMDVVDDDKLGSDPEVTLLKYIKADDAPADIFVAKNWNGGSMKDFMVNILGYDKSLAEEIVKLAGNEIEERTQSELSVDMDSIEWGD